MARPKLESAPSPERRVEIAREAIAMMEPLLRTEPEICTAYHYMVFIEDLRSLLKHLEAIAPRESVTQALIEMIREFEARVSTTRNCMDGCLRVCAVGDVEWEEARAHLLRASYDGTGEPYECLLADRAIELKILAMEAADPSIHTKYSGKAADAYWKLREQLGGPHATFGRSYQDEKDRMKKFAKPF